MKFSMEEMKRAGIDYEDGLKRMSGNETLYRRFLKKFLEDNSILNLKECIAAGDVEGSYEAAHTLKGTSGTLGLYRLSNHCDAICKSIREKESVSDIQAVCASYDIATEIIRKI